ncbi:DUF3102 domain-containing protein [Methylocella sp. CPCC 101449]|uniref:DUF3102 domain-containing protein n=1 Tax=Methylocella sp. CPCC 101449 TaxID=2987531 RepID=UPI00288F4258|nr:DUF3102 domain-containing protein [Methylocella sp. CPCC 101449]MDT2023775.1 DUF3102 domain-containing protein [Methylocella sp. CPCC 101449]
MYLNAELSAKELQEAALRIKALRRAATEHAVEIGQELLRVKEKLPHGVFVKWVEKACEFKIRTAQDLMKLAREVESDAKLVALMVPSTLRVYLSKTTPPAVRNTILKRLESGERVSRSELYSQISDTKPKAEAGADRRPARKELSSSFLAGPETPKTAGKKSNDADGDRARLVAELILQRLTPKDYEFIMEGMNWEVWNRAFVWMRATQILDAERLDVTISKTPLTDSS